MREVFPRLLYRLAILLEVMSAFPLVREEVGISVEMSPEMVEALRVRHLVRKGVAKVPFPDETCLVSISLEYLCDC